MNRIHSDVRNVTTPWGMAQRKTEYADGITFYSTSSHGGFKVSAKRFAEMPERIRAVGTFAGDPGWFEEDCDWALVAVAFPQYFSGYEHFQAVKTLENYQPKALAQEDKDCAAAWLEANRNLWTTGTQGTTDKFGWFVNAYSLVDPAQQTSREFPGVPIIPATFTKDEFIGNDWPIYRR